MTDEVLYYASSEFMSRRGIENGSLTLHPDGLTHGPHPGRAEASVGQSRTDELAVMIDTSARCRGPAPWPATTPTPLTRAAVDGRPQATDGGRATGTDGCRQAGNPAGAQR
jgi:hypothetical protein